MKNRIIFALLLAVVAWLAWLFWPRNEDAPATATRPGLAAPQGGGDPGAMAPPAAAVTAADLQATPLTGPIEAVKKRIADIRAGLGFSNLSVEFYGLVVDQDDRPMSGVTVVLSVMRSIEALPGVQGARSSEVVRKTDEDGRFSLMGVSGYDVSIKSVNFPGYKLSPKARRGFRYIGVQDIHKPDTRAPVVFRLWRIMGAERLIPAEKFYGIVPDGRTYAIDLVNMTKTEGGTGGDFTVSIRRPAQISPGVKYDWSCVIEGVGGGVIETQDEFMYRAPESGYVAHCEIKMAADDPQWSKVARRQFYYKSTDGKVHARMEVEVLSDYQDKAVFSLKYYANPNGSRNLEFDPQQYLQPEPQASGPRP